jgi:hypothetical protein
MSTVKSFLELYNEFIVELQNQASDLTDTNDGSMIDILAGVTAMSISEVSRIVIEEFMKTFFDTAHGPEITGGPDDLQTLAVDHFGSTFARPAATYATGIIAFSRANTNAGNCVIPAGTVVKTAPDSNGESQRFETETQVTMTGTTINATINAVVAGTDGNVNASTITVIESALTDSSITCTNAAGLTGGAEEQNDAEYRETIKNKIITLTGATLAAIQAAAKTVSGVVSATAIETEMIVIEYDIATGLAKAGEKYFRIPRVSVYIADANGTADANLIADVEAAIALVRAAGVRVNVLAGTGLELDWSASITLNPAGPNFTEFSSDASQIIATMTDYVNNLAIGADFVRATADAAMLAIWGPSGTDDLTAFTTSTPIGDVSTTAGQKVVPGTLEIV